MKKVLNYLGVILLTVITSVTGVNAATSSRQINSYACNQVYTNYYFLLDANSESKLSTLNLNTFDNNTTATFNNNYYSTYFTGTNIGYGQVKLDKTSTDSTDGITSMSLDTFYGIYLKAIKGYGNYTNTYTLNCNSGACYNSNKTKNYFVSHDWDSLDNSNGSTTLNFTNGTVNAMKAATLNAYSEITAMSNINSSSSNPFELKINRNYYGTLTNMPTLINNVGWYLHPAVYYVQYCADNGVYSNGAYTIYYDGNGNGDYVSNVPNTNIVVSNQCTTISTYRPSRTGYTFLGWSTNPYATYAETTFNPGTRYCGTNNGNITLYAVWRQNSYNNSYYPNYSTTGTYSINYNANTTDAVTNLPSTTYASTSINAYISSNIPVRYGYTFLGWSTNPYATYADSTYAPGSLYTSRTNVNLYAVWSYNSTNNSYYTISYNANTNDTVTNLPSYTSVLSIQDAYISANTPVRSGYTFLGWSTDAYATTANSTYAPNALYTDRKNVVLYAIWTPNSGSSTNNNNNVENLGNTITNPATGITDYLLPIGGAITASGTGLGILKKKKKNTFKQF